MLKNFWNDPVWSKAIAGTILGAGALPASYFLNRRPIIRSFATTAYDFAFFSTALPNWAIGFLGLLAAPTVVVVVVLTWRRIFPASSNIIDWKNYRTDNFFGLRWRWNYFDGGQIYEIHTFCPHCDFQVYAEDASAYRAIDRIAFRCDSCGQRLGEFDEPYQTLEHKVKRFIQQKIRNGSWVTTSSA